MSIVQDTLNKLYEQRDMRANAGRIATATLARTAGPHETSPLPPGPVSPAALVRMEYNSLRAAGLLPPELQERELAEQFRDIKRPLIAAATGRGAPRLPAGHLIMVTSALAGEGKTFTCINLAISMAFEKDTRVLLVDADVAKPQITRFLGLGSKPGLLDALRDSTLNVDSLILPTDVPGLSVLPAGQPVEHMTELLASTRMQEIVRRVGEHDPHRFALFDSPSLLLTTESVALAQAVGHIVLVVRAGATPQQSVLDAIERLGGGIRVSVALNQTRGLGRERPKLHGDGSTRESPTVS